MKQFPMIDSKPCWNGGKDGGCLEKEALAGEPMSPNDDVEVKAGDLAMDENGNIGVYIENEYGMALYMPRHDGCGEVAEIRRPQEAKPDATVENWRKADLVWSLHLKWFIDFADDFTGEMEEEWVKNHNYLLFPDGNFDMRTYTRFVFAPPRNTGNNDIALWRAKAVAADKCLLVGSFRWNDLPERFFEEAIARVEKGKTLMFFDTLQGKVFKLWNFQRDSKGNTIFFAGD